MDSKISSEVNKATLVTPARHRTRFRPPRHGRDGPKEAESYRDDARSGHRCILIDLSNHLSHDQIAAGGSIWKKSMMADTDVAEIGMRHTFRS